MKADREFSVYTSRGTAKSIGQSYHIYRDRVELHTILGRKIIPFEELTGVELRPPNIRLLFEDFRRLRKFWAALKIDLVDFNEHIAIDRKKGIFKRLLITPDEPAEFKRVIEKTMDEFKVRRERSFS